MNNIFEGKVYKTNIGGDCIIISYKNSTNVTVRFLDKYNYTVKTNIHDLKRGAVRNPYYPSVKGVGEGVVLLSECGNYIFKSKGEKHSVSKVKTMTSADTYEMSNIENFVSDVLTENRLKQGIDYLKEMGFDIDNTSTGEYIKWVQADILKEEGDIIESKSLDIKKVNGVIAKKAKSYLFSL